MRNMLMSIPPKVTVLVCTLNEEENLAFVLPNIPEVDEIIIVDGHSFGETVDRRGNFAPRRESCCSPEYEKEMRSSTQLPRLQGDHRHSRRGRGNGSKGRSFIDALRSGADFANGLAFRPRTPQANALLSKVWQQSACYDLRRLWNPVHGCILWFQWILEASLHGTSTSP